GEVGIKGAALHLATLSAFSDASGYYVFNVGPRSYTLKQDPPPGYAPLVSPDSASITVPPATAHNFPDSLRHGGWVNVTVFNDVNGNGRFDTGETYLSDVAIT